MRLVAVDPGFAAMGFAALELLSAQSVLHAIKLVKTKPGNKKLRLGAADDDARRLTEIEDHFFSFLREHKPVAVAIEDPPWGKSAKAVKSCALMWGMVHGVARANGLFVVSVSAKEVKKRVTDNSGASKEDVFAALKVKHPYFTDWPATEDFEHVADAVGVGEAARYNPLISALLSRSLQR